MDSSSGDRTLVVFVGPQGSGKSTFYRQRLEHTHILVSKDRMPYCRNKERRQMRLVEEALRAGSSVVVDNTNPTPSVREALIRLGRVTGTKLVAYWFSSGLEDCIHRNSRRSGRFQVPPGIIAQTYHRTVRPSTEEGFDEVLEVRLDPSGSYEVYPADPCAVEDAQTPLSQRNRRRAA